MVSEVLPVKHPCSPDSQRFTPKHSAAVRMHEEHCGFPNRSVSVASRVDLTLFLTWLFTCPQSRRFIFHLATLVNKKCPWAEVFKDTKPKFRNGFIKNFQKGLPFLFIF